MSSMDSWSWPAPLLCYMEAATKSWLPITSMAWEAPSRSVLGGRGLGGSIKVSIGRVRQGQYREGVAWEGPSRSVYWEGRDLGGSIKVRGVVD